MTEDQFGRRSPVGPTGGASAANASAANASAGSGSADREPTSGEEQALRALLHRAVDGLQPDAEALPRIRRAIPARRVRHRQAWTGAMLIAMVSAAAVPTLRGLGALQLSDGSAVTPGATPGATSGGWLSATARPGGARSVVPLPVPDASAGAASGSPSGTASAPVGGSPSASAQGATAGAAASGVTATAVVHPACGRGDLGGGQATVSAPDTAGWVYGAFTVANVSGYPCALTDPGTISAVIGGSGGGTVRVLAHTTGDPATNLPDPASATGELLLGPGAGYRVRFAFLPDAPCPANGPAAGGGQSPPASPSASAATPAASGGASPSSGGAGPAGAPAGGGSAAGAAPAGAAADRVAAGGDQSPLADGGPASVAATLSPTPTATGSPTTTPTPAAVQLGYRPLGTAPDAAGTSITGVCGGGTLYRGAPEAAG
ncbi:hypothetical protein ABH930_000592 [Kitasatospora sp. GAS204A]|uniref:hypothetical protein n=1 Tax=unclassified Kitasatospora TaxID=2633591 RepID=UPI002475AC16|nr:hypothetical protein [Kitasatospora sp. GAS204B]MDH6119350.1 hypothetical protein [Kitasatospora sp. GAS204B]